MGIYYMTYRNLMAGYYELGDVEEKWDRHARIGIIAAEKDPKLAEAAWRRALQAGMPLNPLVEYM